MSIYMRGFDPFFNFINYGALRLAAIILSLIAIFVLAITVFKRGKNSDGIKRVLFDFFNFNALCISRLLKAAYLLIFLFNTIYGCLLLFVNPINALMYIVVYNLIARVVFELIMIFVKIEENTRCKCNCDSCDCDCDCCDCCDCYDIEDIDLDEDFDENDATIIIEDITDEVIEDMRIKEENEKKAKARVKKEVSKEPKKETKKVEKKETKKEDKKVSKKEN